MTSPRIAASWPAPLATTAIWALAVAGAVFWGLRIAAPADGFSPPAAAAPPVAIEADAVSRLLGGIAAPEAARSAPAAASRFALAGVVTGGPHQGAALIAIDGQPARPFRVGARVGDQHVLQSVGLRSATLGADAQGVAAINLALPLRASAGTAVPVQPRPSVAPGVVPSQGSVPPAVMAPVLPGRSS